MPEPPPSTLLQSQDSLRSTAWRDGLRAFRTRPVAPPGRHGCERSCRGL